MRRPLFGYLLLAVTVFVPSASVVAQESFTPLAGWDRQLFPSYLIATATIRLPEEDQVDTDDEDVVVLGDPQGVLGIEIESPADDTPITVTITGSAILERSTFHGTLETEGVTYRIFPRIRYKYGVLTRNKQAIPVTVTYSVEVDDEDAEEETATLTLRSINDCPFAVVHGDDETTDISFMFAAYVNEQHPFVDKLLREALDEGIVDSFAGYQSGEADDVYRQVYALWNALSARDVRYSNITTSAAVNQAVYSQHVRLIDESINNSQANCVDGSVLLASLLRKIDIEPLLVYVPGHCYLAFYLDEKQTRLIGLETTLIGSEGDDAPVPAELKNVVDEDWRDENSWKTFCAAIAIGNADLVENQAKFNQDDADYQLVSIQAARQLGILPIAFDSQVQFQTSGSEP